MVGVDESAQLQNDVIITLEVGQVPMWRGPNPAYRSTRETRRKFHATVAAFRRTGLRALGVWH